MSFLIIGSLIQLKSLSRLEILIILHYHIFENLIAIEERASLLRQLQIYQGKVLILKFGYSYDNDYIKNISSTRVLLYLEYS